MNKMPISDNARQAAEKWFKPPDVKHKFPPVVEPVGILADIIQSAIDAATADKDAVIEKTVAKCPACRGKGKVPVGKIGEPIEWLDCEWCAELRAQLHPEEKRK